MSISQILDIAGTGMAAQRLRVQLISANIANSETTRTKEGGPYRRKDAVFQSQDMGFSGALAAAGVRVAPGSPFRPAPAEGDDHVRVTVAQLRAHVAEVGALLAGAARA